MDNTSSEYRTDRVNSVLRRFSWRNTAKSSRARLRWFGLMQRKGNEYVSRRMLRIDLPGRRPGCREDMMCVYLTMTLKLWLKY